MKKVLGIIMAGGEGRRLKSLTSDVRAKPAVPFGGKYRIIDFVLSNFFNSGIKQICVLTQHKSFSLVQHIETAWAKRLGSRTEFIRCLGPNPPSWYKGTADCVYQNIMQIYMTQPDYVAVFGGDHIYKMNVDSMVDFHTEKNADLTVCAIRFPIELASSFGVIEVDENFRMVNFEEKPPNPKPIPGDPKHALVSMGNYTDNSWSDSPVLYVYQLNGERFYNSDDESSYKSVNMTGNQITGTPYCGKPCESNWWWWGGCYLPMGQKERARPRCGVSPWFKVDGDFRAFPATKPTELTCAESVKAHCDSLWEPTSDGCGGTKYLVPDALKTGISYFENYANRGNCVNFDEVSADNIYPDHADGNAVLVVHHAAADDGRQIILL